MNDIFPKLENLPFFTLEALRSLLGKNPLPAVKYNLKIGKLVRLKKGVYVSCEFLKKIKYQGKYQDYLEFLASSLISPSYLSLEYMLAKYALLSEAPFTLTAITTKTPRIIKNSLGTFVYYNIKGELFSGFKIVERPPFKILVASRPKALFDYLYLRKRIFRTVNAEVVRELRLNLDELTAGDWQELQEYLALGKSKKLESIFKFLR
jgi:predicted transcriptional regulator of viral defense system